MKGGLFCGVAIGLGRRSVGMGSEFGFAPGCSSSESMIDTGSLAEGMGTARTSVPFGSPVTISSIGVPSKPPSPSSTASSPSKSSSSSSSSSSVSPSPSKGALVAPAGRAGPPSDLPDKACQQRELAYLLGQLLCSCIPLYPASGSSGLQSSKPNADKSSTKSGSLIDIMPIEVLEPCNMN